MGAVGAGVGQDGPVDLAQGIDVEGARFTEKTA